MDTVIYQLVLVVLCIVCARACRQCSREAAHSSGADRVFTNDGCWEFKHMDRTRTSVPSQPEQSAPQVAYLRALTNPLTWKHGGSLRGCKYQGSVVTVVCIYINIVCVCVCVPGECGFLTSS